MPASLAFFKSLFRRLTVLLVTTSLVACTTVRPVPLGQSEKPSLYGRQDDLHLGDKISVTTVDGRVLDMQITELHPETIEGKIPGQTSTIQLRDEDVQHIQRTEISGAKSTGLAVGVVALVILVPMLLLMHAFGSIV
ncbi:hypothetical protein [Ideonella sp. B508-1]|uniref:hypothetical protein n=1 Tax=Ideonella sp. B508-1 TaxID=137716 RepID=UPI0003B790F0|nr:hypothetical protein [Ideonella sp. B508-1]